MLISEHLLQSLETKHRITSPQQLATLTHLDQDMKHIMDSSLPQDQKIQFVRSTFELISWSTKTNEN